MTNRFRMTSDPHAATSFNDEAERLEAVKFAKNYKASNYVTHDVNPRQRDLYGANRVHLPTFAGDLWVTTETNL